MSLGMNSVGLNQPYSRQIAMRANSEQTVQAQEQVQTQPEYTLTDVFKHEHKKNGLVERAYNGVKNLTGLGTGSKKVKAVIEDKLNAEGVEITEATSFKDDLNADSLDLFELIMALEDEFGTEIPSEDLEKLTTVGDVLNYLTAKGVE